MWNLERDPFLRYSSALHKDIVTDGFIRILSDTGLDAFSMAALARWMKVSAAAVAQRASKAETLRLIAVAMAERWRRWATPVWVPEGQGMLPTPLPATEAEALGVRAWLLAGELARTRAAAGDERPAEALALGWAADRANWEAWWTRLPTARAAATDGDFEEFWVVLQGVRIYLAFLPAPDPALVGAAQRVLARLLDVH
ncbi:hypothetical protein [Nocardioides sp.]|uniref:hypothetical protein n=1 Tax=Nocardioides sp. TaxID=35761 RepID=UPI002BBCE536|nr:hypothetical protein [Nocardioides sp.]HSX66062.1 hypothetical protein [Nocardioides sp.]